MPTTTTKLDIAFTHCREEGRAALMPFLTCGYPSMAQFEEFARGVIASGADVLEIGFPHSDPLADGPVIQRASHVSLEHGFKLTDGFSSLAELSRLGIPLVIMCYSNVILRFGAERFVSQAAESQVSGLIVPDMIIEESKELRDLCAKNNVAFINLITPTTTPDRIDRIIEATTGFLYVVSVTGTTGARTQLDPSLPGMVKNLKSKSALPICVGFGVSTPEMAGEVGGFSDGVIVGSKLLSLIDPAKNGSEQTSAFNFVGDLHAALGGSHD
jgi:tryptophan synthase alpha chain